MQPFPQKLPRLWFTQNIRYFVYFLREFTGIIIVLYLLRILVLGWFPFHGWVETVFKVGGFLALAASIFHTLTWLYVTTKLSPIALKPAFQKIIYVILIFVWLAVSYFSLIFFFENLSVLSS